MGTSLLTILGILFALAVGAIVFVLLIIPFFKLIGWVLSRLFGFITSEIGDAFRLIGAILTALVYVPMIVGSVLIARWSAASHFGRAFQSELATIAACLYRLVIGNPARLFGLERMIEGLEKRIPDVVRAAPGGDTPSPRTGQFEGYKIVGSLAGGGSGAKLYIAVPDEVKLAAFARAGIRDVSQVVIKSFSLADGSSLPQIVRESRSLDAAKRLGLILDHELTQHRFFYVMRYVPGEPLSIVTRRLHAASPSEGLAEPQLRLAIGYVCDLLSTLSEYHKGGLWHKDVKPDNIIVDGGPNPRAHLVDFGLVSSLRSAMTLTTHGTEYFRDPELVRQALKGVKVHQVDGTRFDIYAAGAVLFSVIEDSFPAHGVLSQVTKRCPDAVKWIIRRAMTDYDKRYTSADLMLADLQTVVRAPDPYAVRPVDLPSMSGEPAPTVTPDVMAPPPPAAAAAAGTPNPAHPAAAVGDAPRASEPRRAPRLRVVNWWSGRAEFDPSDPRAAQGVQRDDLVARAEELAEMSVRTARQALEGAWAGLQTGFGRSPREPAAPAKPWVPPTGPRKPAKEQIASARARVEAARARARNRVETRLGDSGYPSRGMAGVVAGVGIFIAVVGLVVVNAFRLEARPQQVNAASLSPSLFVNGEPVFAADIKPLRKTPDNLRILVINDMRHPWSPQVQTAMGQLTRSLEGASVKVVGEMSDDPNAGRGEVDAAARARLVLDSVQVPVDSREAPARFADYFSENKTIDAVLWLAPALGDPQGQPRMFLFAPSGMDADRTRAIAGTIAKSAEESEDDEER